VSKPALPAAGSYEELVRLETASRTQALGPLGRRLADALVIDETTGAVDVDADELRRQFARAFGSWGAAFADVASAYAARGMAVLGPLEERGSPVAMPWMVMEDVVWRLRGAPPDLRAALGVAGARSGREASKLLRRAHQGVPDDLFPAPVTRLLTKNPAALMNGRERELNGLEEPPDERRPRGPVGGPTGVAGPVTGSTSLEVVQAAECLLNGTWGGWWDGLGGWAPGFRVCLDQNCADILGRVLLSTLYPGPISLAKAIYTLLQQGLGAALAGLLSAASVALAFIGFALGVNIMMVNGPTGVCIYCSWPYTGGIVFWAAPA
jgi:hypothetical protein